MAGLSGVVQSNKPYLQPGKMRHRIQLVQPTLVQDGMGGWSVNLDKVLLVTWASIESLSAQEKFAAHEFASEVTHKIWIRDPRSALPGGVTSGMQIWYNTKQWQVAGVLNPTSVPYALCIMAISIDSSVNQVTPSAPESSL